MNKEIIFSLMEEYEKYSSSNILQVDNGWFTNNSDIRWFANYVNSFEDENIPEYYLNDHIAKNTRWDLWNDVIDVFIEYNIKSNLDIGCANNHFSFLCNKKNIFSIGIEPREDCLRSSDSAFKNSFGESKYGYIGNFKTFVEFFSKYDNVMFDCVTILNFLHGNDHISAEIEGLFQTLPKITNKIIISEPNWSALKLPKLTENYNLLCPIHNRAEHFLYDLRGN